MADNIVDISILCPVKFREQGYTNPLPYNTKYMEDWNYPDTRRSFEEQQDYFHPWQQNDIIPLQVLSNYAPHQLELYDCSGILVDTFQLGYVSSSIEGIGVKVYEANIALNTYPEGIYYFLLKSGDPVLKTMESEKFYLKSLHENTVLLQYKHSENDFDTVFETGVQFNFRTFGGLVEYQPGADRTVFIDQPRNLIQLSGKSFSTGKLLIGEQYGVPNWVVQRINQIFLCSEVLIDGKQYVGNEGAKFDPNREQLYPMAGWTWEVRSAKAENKKRFIADGEVEGTTTLVYQIEGNGFGSITDPASSNIIQIEQINE